MTGIIDGMKRNVTWIAAAAIIVIAFGTMYGTVQQSQRMAANSPQIQLAEDVAAQLDASKAPANVVAALPAVNIGRSLAPFVIIYDKSGKAVAGSGLLDGKLPAFPAGSLTAARGHDYNAITWQPQADKRFAAVSVAADEYYVLSARSLREVEKNETQSLYLASIGEVGSLLILLILFLTTRRDRKRSGREA